MTTYDETTVNIDPFDYKGMIALMDKADTFKTRLTGQNGEGETVLISINHDNITTETLQHNNWTRENIYYRDGSTEELFHR